MSTPVTGSEAKWKVFFANWAITTLGVVVAANVISGIQYDSISALLVASLLLGVFNAVLRPILMLLTLPIMILTLGLFTTVINASLLYLVGYMVRTFHVPSFKTAFWGGLIISIVGWFARAALGIKNTGPTLKFNVNAKGKRTAPPPNQPVDRGGSGSGPVIDV